MSDDDKLIDPEGNVDEKELERRIKAMGLDSASTIENAKQEAAKIDAEFEEKLRALEAKAQDRQSIRENQQREIKRKMTGDRDSAKGLGVGLSIAYTIIGLPLVGVVIGWFLDERSGTQVFKGIGVLVGSVLGIVATVIMLSRTNK